MSKWLDKYNDGGPVQPNYNDASVSLPEGFVGTGYDTKGRNYSPAWGGQFQMGGSLPGATGMMYARIGGAPSNGPYAKKTKASAQNGKEMQFYQNGLDWKPNGISRNGNKVIEDPRGQWAHPGEVTRIPSNDITMEGVPYPVLGISDTGHKQMMYPNEHYMFDGNSVTEYPQAQNGILSKSDIEKRLALEKDIKNQKARNTQSTISQYTPKAGDQERMNAARDAYRTEEAKPLNRAASSKVAANAMNNIVEPMVNIEMAMGAGKLAKPALEAAGKYLTEETALKNTYKLNPYAFKPNPEYVYRGIGEAGYKDAIESGVFKSPRGIDKTYWADANEFNYAKNHSRTIGDDLKISKSVVAEYPKNRGTFNMEQKGKMVDALNSTDVLPVAEGKILQQHWLQGYKEIPKPTNTQSITRGPIDWAGGVNRELNPNFDARGYENQMKSPYEPPITGEGAPYIKHKNGGWLNKYK